MGLLVGAIASLMVAPQMMTDVAYAATAGCGPFDFVCAIAFPGSASACAGTLCVSVLSLHSLTSSRLAIVYTTHADIELQPRSYMAYIRREQLMNVAEDLVITV